MADYQIAFHLRTKHAVIQAAGDAVPAPVGGTNYNIIGTFEHADVESDIKDLEFDVNHVFHQHVRDALYHVNASTGLAVPGTLQFPNNITDMAGLVITTDVAGIELGAAFSLAVGEEKQLAPVFTPADLGNGRAVTYASSDATKATVSSNGLVKAIAAGSSTITATCDGETDTVVVTVTA